MMCPTIAQRAQMRNQMRPAEEYVGLDLDKNLSQICILTGTGEPREP